MPTRKEEGGQRTDEPERAESSTLGEEPASPRRTLQIRNRVVRVLSKFNAPVREVELLQQIATEKPSLIRDALTSLEREGRVVRTDDRVALVRGSEGSRRERKPSSPQRANAGGPASLLAKHGLVAGDELTTFWIEQYRKISRETGQTAQALAALHDAVLRIIAEFRKQVDEVDTVFVQELVQEGDGDPGDWGSGNRASRSRASACHERFAEKMRELRLRWAALPRDLATALELDNNPGWNVLSDAERAQRVAETLELAPPPCDIDILSHSVASAFEPVDTILRRLQGRALSWQHDTVRDLWTHLLEYLLYEAQETEDDAIACLWPGSIREVPPLMAVMTDLAKALHRRLTWHYESRRELSSGHAPRAAGRRRGRSRDVALVHLFRLIESTRHGEQRNEETPRFKPGEVAGIAAAVLVTGGLVAASQWPTFRRSVTEAYRRFNDARGTAGREVLWLPRQRT